MKKHLYIFLLLLVIFACDTEPVLKSILTSEVQVPQRYPAGDIQINAPEGELPLSWAFAMSEKHIFLTEPPGENIYVFDSTGNLVKTIKRPPIRGNTIGFRPSEVNRPNSVAGASFVDGFLYLRVFAEIAPTWGRQTVVRIHPETEEITNLMREHEAYRDDSVFDRAEGMIEVHPQPGYQMPLFSWRGYHWTLAAERTWILKGASYEQRYARFYYQARDPVATVYGDDLHPVVNTVIPGEQITLEGQNIRKPISEPWANIDIRNYAAANGVDEAFDPKQAIIYRGVTTVGHFGCYITAFSAFDGSHLYDIKIDDVSNTSEFYGEIEFARDALYVFYREASRNTTLRCFK